jgi:hypothetical protein
VGVPLLKKIYTWAKSFPKNGEKIGKTKYSIVPICSPRPE